MLLLARILLGYQVQSVKRLTFFILRSRSYTKATTNHPGSFEPERKLLVKHLTFTLQRGNADHSFVIRVREGVSSCPIYPYINTSVAFSSIFWNRYFLFFSPAGKGGRGVIQDTPRSTLRFIQLIQAQRFSALAAKSVRAFPCQNGH